MKALVLSIWAVIFLGNIALWRVIIVRTHALLSMDKATEPLALLILGSSSLLLTYLIKRCFKNRKPRVLTKKV